jgi:hypothetical protein
MTNAVIEYRGHEHVRSEPGRLRRAMHPFVPAGFHDPIGLARRLLRIKDPAALFAMRAAALAPLAMPLDLLLVPVEKLRYRRATAPERPILLVCGAARSGTTLSAQLLMRNLKVSHFSNLTSIFPRSPLIADSTIGRFVTQANVTYRSFYGRTSGWSGPNDALYLWDRWLGRDRTRAPEWIAPKAQRAMVSFFGAMEQAAGRPTLGKNNALNASAHLVAEVLPTARFICIVRSRIPLALSLLKARIDIHGETGVPYGLMPRDRRHGNDPIEDVCRQVLFHEALARQQLERLGPERFRLVHFEDVCRDPRGFVERIGSVVLGQKPDFASTDPDLTHFAPAKHSEDAVLVARILETFDRIGSAAA